MRDGFLEEATRDGVGSFLERGGGALRNDRAAMDASARAHVDHQVGGTHGVLVVFYNEDRVAAIAEIFQRADEPIIVPRVQADARFVEHVKRAGKRRAQLRRESDTLRFAARERVGAAVECEVAKADGIQEAEAGADFG